MNIEGALLSKSRNKCPQWLKKTQQQQYSQGLKIYSWNEYFFYYDPYG